MSESKEPPRLPDVVDEAGPSPRWLPWLGFGLLCAVALLLVARELTFKNPGASAAEAEVGAEGAGAEAAGAAAPAAPAAHPDKRPAQPAAKP